MDNITQKLNLRLKKKANELRRLNHTVKLSLPLDCHEHMEIAGIRDNQLIILTDSPVWQTRLRLYSHAILEALLQCEGIKLNRVKLRLAPKKRVIQEEPPVARYLNQQSAELIAQTASCINDPALSSALLKLSKKIKPDNQSH